jgi:hypothetical protein
MTSRKKAAIIIESTFATIAVVALVIIVVAA